MRSPSVKAAEEELRLLANLKNDLRVLQNSWNTKKLRRKKVLKHFIGIVDSLVNICRSESLEPFETACTKVREHLKSVAAGKVDFEERVWPLTMAMMDLLNKSLDNGSPAFGGLQQWQARWRGEPTIEESMITDSEIESLTEDSPTPDSDDDGRFPEEEMEMANPNHINPQQLLEEAQEALISGNAEVAKELAMKAADLIAKLEAEEAVQKEKKLRAALETVVHEESEAQDIISELKKELSDKEGKLSSMQDRMAQAKASVEQHERGCDEIKKSMDETAAELEALKEKQRLLHDQLQEVLPARDAANRECSRIKEELDRLASEIAPVREEIEEAERTLAEVHDRKLEAEAQLEKLVNKVAA